jgi:hypothetical protein
MASSLGIAALTVARVHESHAAAAATFTSRRYVVAPAPTPYPPNLAHDPQTPAAVLRERCIVSLQHDHSTAHSTPDRSTDVQWSQQVKFYHLRQKKQRLRVAECRLQQVGGRDVLHLNPAQPSRSLSGIDGGEQARPILPDQHGVVLTRLLVGWQPGVFDTMGVSIHPVLLQLPLEPLWCCHR